MALTGPASYVSTTEDFLAHWEAANTSLGAGNEVKRQGGITRAKLQAYYDVLVAKRLDLAAKLNLEETSRGDLEARKTDLLLRINQFNELYRNKLPTQFPKGHPIVNSLPDVTVPTSAKSVYFRHQVPDFRCMVCPDRSGCQPVLHSPCEFQFRQQFVEYMAFKLYAGPSGAPFRQLRDTCRNGAPLGPAYPKSSIDVAKIGGLRRYFLLWTATQSHSSAAETPVRWNRWG